jgi:anti-sigma-K factor RskA
MTHDDLTPYLLGELSTGDAAEYELHLQSCDTCQSEMRDLAPLLEAIADDVATAPSPELRDRVLADIATTPQVIPMRRSRKQWMLGAAAALAIVLAAGSFLFQQDPVSDLVAASDAVVVQLAATEAYVEPAQMQAVYRESDGAMALIAESLEPADDGRTYQAWLIGDNGPVSAGVFVPDEDGTARLILDATWEPGSLIGVTLEPAGGSRQPTSDVLFVTGA